jgi:hypothetical protein
MQIRTGRAGQARRARRAYLMLVNNGEGRTVLGVMQYILGRQGSEGTRRRYGVVKRGRVPEGASTVASEPREGGKQRK